MIRNEYRVLPPHLRAKIEGLHTHKELYEAVGGPYYQILPVGSIVYPGTWLPCHLLCDHLTCPVLSFSIYSYPILRITSSDPCPVLRHVTLFNLILLNPPYLSHASLSVSLISYFLNSLIPPLPSLPILLSLWILDPQGEHLTAPT